MEKIRKNINKDLNLSIISRHYNISFTGNRDTFWRFYVFFKKYPVDGISNT